MARLLVSSAPWSLARSIPRVFVELLDAGAELVFAGEAGKQPVPTEILGHPGVSTVALPLTRGEEGDDAVRLLRRLSDLNRFLDPALAESRWPRRRTAERALVLLEVPEPRTTAERIAGLTVPEETHRNLTSLMNGLERILPPPKGLAEALRATGADSVLLVSRCSLGGAERDVLKAARAAGLPTAMLVWSWDNLSSKTLLNEQPDHLLVWNEWQADEAERLHAFPRERVRVVGAANFDPFLDALGALPREVRPEDGQKTILYLGSSKNICRREPEVFERWLSAVRSAASPAVRDARIVVRPYPGGFWSRWEPSPDGGYDVAPARRNEPARLAELLLAADAVVALNTSAEIEAALAGRPVVTFRAGVDAPGQEGSIHFEYLLAENGGFVIDANDLVEHVQRLADVLERGAGTEQLRPFTERFIRPHGLDRPAAPVVARTILELAG